LAVAALVTFQFWNVEPRSDGMLFFRYAQQVWDRPLAIEHFWAGWNHRESYISMGLLGLAYRLGIAPVAGLRVVQLVVSALGLVAFSILCHQVFPRITSSKAGLLNLVFALTPAYLAYFVGVALDFVALTFLLSYLTAVCARRFLIAAVLGAAFAFCKESSFLHYLISLPLVLAYSARRFGPVGRWPYATRALFLLPLVPKGFAARSAGSEQTRAMLEFCQQESIATFLFSSNVERAEIQNYLIDLFLLNFQWLLLIAVVAAAVRLVRLQLDPALATGDDEEVGWAPFFLVLGFLATGLYVLTRCVGYNSVKYVLQVMPLWLLVVHRLSVHGLPDPRWRTAFLVAVAVLFSVSAVRTFDPVSLAIFGRYEGEARTMLCMNSRMRPPEERQCGNDELIYNLQLFLP
jgi:hypothetical protein